MKKITLNQYGVIKRTVIIIAEDDCTEKMAAEMLSDMPLRLDPDENERMPENSVVPVCWHYVSNLRIETPDGKVVLNNEA